jgi:hypothetical protein
MAAAMKRPHDVKLSREAGEALIERLEGDALTAEDRCVLVQVLRLYFWLMLVLQEAKLSLKRFRQMLFGEPAQGRYESVLEPSAEAETGGHDASTALDKCQEARVPRQRGGHRAGQGRLGAAAYVGAERIECRHEELAPGDRCPVCARD